MAKLTQEEEDHLMKIHGTRQEFDYLQEMFKQIKEFVRTNPLVLEETLSLFQEIMKLLWEAEKKLSDIEEPLIKEELANKKNLRALREGRIDFTTGVIKRKRGDYDRDDEKEEDC
jgi:hypothetical protein